MTRAIEKADAKIIEAGLTVQEHLDIQEGQLRRDIAKKITTAFIVVNLGVLLLVFLTIVLDHIFIFHQHIKGAERLVTTQLIMTIVGATTVQLGAVAFSMSSWLFPKVKARS